MRSSLLQVVPTTWKRQLKQYLSTAREHTCYYLFPDLLQLVRLLRVYITRFCIGQCMGFKQLIKIGTHSVHVGSRKKDQLTKLVICDITLNALFFPFIFPRLQI